MKILLATSEATPFAKTGGLADVSGALPLELARLGHEPTVIMPAYRKTLGCGAPIESLDLEFIVQVGSKTVAGHLLKSHLPNSEVPVYLVRQDEYFDRDELYREADEDFPDNCERFTFFSRAVMEAIRILDLEVDVIHANDWQTGLIPAYLKLQYARMPRYEKIASLLTIHNLAYQGVYWHWDMLLTGLDWRHFNWQEMEFFGKLNLLKTGMVYADAINTVSPRYAEEIQTTEFGCGLEGVLQSRSASLTGILNGINPAEWSPGVDSFLATNYDVDSVTVGKPVCKAALQERMGLPVRPDVMLIGMIGRLAEQKGFDMIDEILPEWIEKPDVQWVILGTGDELYEKKFADFAQRFPDRVAARLDFSNQLAHEIEAGADLFVMPSRYEPCGLNQMYSLAYGTVPLVRRTGGLADTIVDADEFTLEDGTANGFSFDGATADDLNETLHRAHEAFGKPEVWNRLVDTGMRQDWTWASSAKQYEKLYESLLRKED